MCLYGAFHQNGKGDYRGLYARSTTFCYNISMKKVIKVKNEEKMTKLGQVIGQCLQGGEVVALIGNLGAGKTTLAKGILKGTGVKRGFSPTFILDATFKTKRAALKEIHHLDLYRLKSAEELIPLGVYDAIGRPESAFIIEWADRFPELLKAFPKMGKMTIIIKEVLGNERSLLVQTTGKKHEKILDYIASHLN